MLVGPNASGKSNTFAALDYLNTMINEEKTPFYGFTKDIFWTGEIQKFSFDLQVKVKEYQTLYHLEIKADPDFTYHAEQLFVNDVNVISIQDGKGVVRDENNKNEIPYNSNKLALGSAGNYGNKPITNVFAEFIKEWRIYDFDTGFIRQESDMRFSSAETEVRECSELNDAGENLVEVLWNWYKNSPESFQNVSDSLAADTNREIDYRLIDGRYQLFMIEGNENPIPLQNASDGILRLIAYNILLNEPELPPLIAIEEPERNLHPGALTHCRCA